MYPCTRPLLAALLVCALALPAGASGSDPHLDALADPAAAVDPMIGTFAPGFVVPGPATPFGLVQVSPDTEGPFAYSGYLWSDPTIRGFSNLHLSGPGVRKGGDIPLQPTVGPVTSSDPAAFTSGFDHATESASPGSYRVRLSRWQTDVELTATPRTGWQRYTFPPAEQANVLLDVSRSVEGVREGKVVVTGPDEVSGWVRGRYPVHFVARFDRPFASSGTWTGASLAPGSTSAEGRGVGAWVTFDARTDATVTVKVGISLVDVAGARRNLETEAPGEDFDGVRAAARAAWNRELTRVRVTAGTGQEGDRTAFYTALYHALLHPNVSEDVDGRYRGFDDAVHTLSGRAHHYANFSSWDTYKAQNQLLATLYPDRFREMLLSLLADAEQGGKLPRWGEWTRDSSHMSGDPVIPMITDGLCRGVLDPVADRTAIAGLYEEMVDLATVHRPEGMRARGYLDLAESPRGAGTTLEYGVADFALALAADALGRDADRDRWLAQSGGWQHLLDPETRWIRPRVPGGGWHTPFDPTEETGFQEGNSWQYSWLAMHDARRLFDAMGGDAVVLERLDQLFAHELSARAPVAVAEAHNRLNVFGLVDRTATYAPGNEHDLQVPWMYPFAGEPWKTQAVLRQVQGIFRPTPDGLPGNDDLGSLSAWHVWSALGFGPVTPGAPFYVVGAPLFPRVEVDLAAGTLVVDAPGASLVGKYVRQARLGGRQLPRAWFTHAELVQATGTGGLHLQMGTEPDTAWGTAPALRPPAVGTADWAAFGCRP